jgi:hypothetical protein
MGHFSSGAHGVLAVPVCHFWRVSRWPLSREDIMRTELRTIPNTFMSPSANPADPFNPVSAGQDSGEIANKTAKGLTLWVVGQIPGAGGLLGAILGPLMDTWWPDGKNAAWEAVKGEVEALVNEKIDDLYKDLVENRLNGVRRVSTLYLDAAKKASTDELKRVAREEWRGVRRAIEQEMPMFIQSTYDWKVLPFFVQLANIHAFLLQELIRNEKSLGWDKEKSNDYDPVEDAKKKLKELLDPPTQWSKEGTGGGTYVQHVKQAYEKGIEKCTEKGIHKGYDYQRAMLRLALDYARDLWPMVREPGKKWPDELSYDREAWLGPLGITGGSTWDDWHKKNRYYPEQAHANICELHIYRRYGNDKRYLCAFQRRYCDKTDWEPVEGADAGERTHYWMWDSVDGTVNRAWMGGNSKGVMSGFAPIREKQNKYMDIWSYLGEEESDVVYQDYGMEDFRISDIRNLNPYKGTGSSARAVMVAFRQTGTWYPKKPVPRSAHFYRFVSPETGHVLGLHQYSLVPGVDVLASAPDGATGQEWQLQATGEGLWALVNRYSGQHLVRQENRCVQADYPTANPEQALWRLDEPDARTWTLCSPDGTEGMDAAGRVRTEASSFARWFALPVLDTDDQPVLRVEKTSRDADNSVWLTLTNPLPNTTVHDWAVSFYLPADAGRNPRVTSQEDVTLRSVITDDKGHHIRLGPGNNHRGLAPGETRSFIVTTTPTDGETVSALIPAAPRLEGQIAQT